jgi:hypothetical protein
MMASCCFVFGKLRNGYEHQLRDCEQSLRDLQLELLKDGLSASLRKKVKSRLEMLRNYIVHYQLTNELLDQLKEVCPEIYYEMDVLKDKKGRPTDVYVKLITKTESIIDLVGSSFFKQADDDKDRNVSEYGEGTVSVKLLVAEHSLRILCHELGHVKYVVPNLASYARFYETHYSSSALSINTVGHSVLDASGNLASQFERKFQKSYSSYLKNGGSRPESLSSLRQKIRKYFYNNENLEPPFDIALLSRNYP